MDSPASSMRDFARRLLMESKAAPGPQIHEAVLVCERMRIPLTRCVGIAGFVSLLRRALLLATEEAPSLQGAKIDAEGRLTGLDQAAAGSAATAGFEAALALASHLLGLLATFIGEPLTLAVVHEAWPDSSRTGKHSTTKTGGTEIVE